MGSQVPLQSFDGSIEQRFHGPHRNPHDSGDFRLPQVLKLRKQKYAALLLRQSGNGLVDVPLQPGLFGCPGRFG